MEPNRPITLNSKPTSVTSKNTNANTDFSQEPCYLIEKQEVISSPQDGLMKKPRESSPPDPDDENLPDNNHMEAYDDPTYIIPPTVPSDEILPNPSKEPLFRKTEEYLEQSSEKHDNLGVVKPIIEPTAKPLAQPIEKPPEEALSSEIDAVYYQSRSKPLSATPTEIPAEPPPPPKEVPESPNANYNATKISSHVEDDRRDADVATNKGTEEEKKEGENKLSTAEKEIMNTEEGTTDLKIAPQIRENSTPSTSGQNKKKGENTIPQRKTAFWLLTPIVLIIILVIYLSFAVPGVMSFVGSAFYALTFGTFFLFIMLGIFVVFGFREQAKTLLEIVFEGGVKYIDIAQFFSELWDGMVQLIQDFILFISPGMAVFLSTIFYYLVMYVFRYMATLGDVTIFTVIMTIVLASITAVLSLGNFGQGEEDSYSFRSQFAFRFGRVFVDCIEIVVAIIFLTIDLPKPFFLPESVHGEVRSQALGIDLMERGIAPDGFTTTIRIAGLGVLIEIVRKIYRITASMIIRYNQLKQNTDDQDNTIETADDMFELLRRASRIAFKDNLDDLTKFLGFTTVLLAVFFFFPRLKLLSLLVFNTSNLVWDIIFPKRAVKPPRSEDLFSRLIAKTFRL